MYRSKRDGVDINIFIIQLVILFLNCPVDNFVYYFYFLVNKCVDLIRALYFLKFNDLFLIVFWAIGLVIIFFTCGVISNLMCCRLVSTLYFVIFPFSFISFAEIIFRAFPNVSEEEHSMSGFFI